MEDAVRSHFFVLVVHPVPMSSKLKHLSATEINYRRTTFTDQLRAISNYSTRMAPLLFKRSRGCPCKEHTPGKALMNLPRCI
jgi:hypothetical protein